MLWLEIQEGKARMSTKEHQRLGSTAACVVRGVQATEKLTRFPTVHDEGQEVSKRLYFGDIWFGSVKDVATVAQAVCPPCLFHYQDGLFKIPKNLVRGEDEGLPRRDLDHIGGYTREGKCTPYLYWI